MEKIVHVVIKLVSCHIFFVNHVIFFVSNVVMTRKITSLKAVIEYFDNNHVYI